MTNASRLIPLAAIVLPIFLTTLAPAGGQQLSPREIVDLFLRVYGTERMADVVPFTTPAFRDGLKPKVWLKRTSTALGRLGYVRLDATIECIATKDNEATVVVISRIKTKAATTKQAEVYSFRQTANGWKLWDLQVEDEALIEVYRTETG